MDNKHQYCIYILTNPSRTLYVGVTNDLERRMYDHKHKLVPGFTSRYNITQLAYFEDFNDINSAIAREKQIKGWTRARKVVLIKSVNPTWRDLSDDWFEESDQGTKDSSTSLRMTRPVTLSRSEGSLDAGGKPGTKDSSTSLAEARFAQNDNSGGHSDADR